MEIDRIIENVGRKIYDLWRYRGGEEYDSKSVEQRGKLTRDQYIDRYVEGRFAKMELARADRN